MKIVQAQREMEMQSLDSLSHQSKATENSSDSCYVRMTPFGHTETGV